MLKAVFIYLRGCASYAWRGSINSALNWASIVGVGVVGAYLEKRGSAMSDPHTWYGIVGWTIVYTVTAWAVIFVFRFVIVAPFHLWRAQKDRADALDGLREIAATATRSPTFDLRFEVLPFDTERHAYGLYPHIPICRIFVENLEDRPIEDCRIILEYFGPVSPINNGALLLPDERSGSEGAPTGIFHLAPTEKRYFKFLEVQQERFSRSDFGSDRKWQLVIKSDQDGVGWQSVNEHRELAVGTRYFATLAVNGKNASSSRVNLTIEVVSAFEISVCESADTNDRQKQNKPETV